MTDQHIDSPDHDPDMLSVPKVIEHLLVQYPDEKFEREDVVLLALTAAQRSLSLLLNDHGECLRPHVEEAVVGAMYACTSHVHELLAKRVNDIEKEAVAEAIEGMEEQFKGD